MCVHNRLVRCNRRLELRWLEVFAIWVLHFHSLIYKLINAKKCWLVRHLHINSLHSLLGELRQYPHPTACSMVIARLKPSSHTALHGVPSFSPGVTLHSYVQAERCLLGPEPLPLGSGPLHQWTSTVCYWRKISYSLVPLSWEISVSQMSFVSAFSGLNSAS